MPKEILIVDDEPSIVVPIQFLMEQQGYNVIVAKNGEDALDIILKYKPDLILLDIMLPGIDGYEVCEIVRLNPDFRNVKIIFLTAKNQTEDVVKGFQAGGNDYIRKPFSMEELIVRMENLLQLSGGQKAQAAPIEKIAIGRYTFSPNKYELKFGEDTRKLSHRESELLKILAGNQNFTVKRKEILQKVWGDDSIFNSRNLDVYITKLRDYLKEDPSVQIITLKGIGYHFSVE